jgi:hypothetical protein
LRRGRRGQGEKRGARERRNDRFQQDLQQRPRPFEANG